MLVFQQPREVDLYRADVPGAPIRDFRQWETPCMAEVLHGRYKAGL